MSWIINNRIYVLIVIVLLVLYSACSIETYKQGKTLYSNYCESCHMADGSGLAKLIPPLASDFYENNQHLISCYIRYGLSDSIVVNGIPYDQIMPSSPSLTDFEIANIINYMDNVILKKDRFKSIHSVRQDLEKCEP